MTFSLARKAGRDMVGIARYTKRMWGVTQAKVYVAELDAAFGRLGQYPRLGRECPELSPGLWRLRLREHMIYYRQREPGVFTVRVLHTSMLPELHL